MSKTIAFTGHRPETLNLTEDQYDDLQLRLWKEIYARMEQGYDTFLCGAARGTDIMCGEIVLAEKETAHPNVKLICAIPFREQARRWEILWRMRHYELLRGADKVVLLCDSYQRGCYHLRNRYMVDNADLLIAVYNGSPKGGTAYTINYARKQGKDIIIINPNE